MGAAALLLALDAGNTSLSVGLFRGGRLVARGRLPTATALERGELGARIAASVGLGSASPSGVIFASVVPPLDRKLAAALGARFGCRVRAVTPSSPLGLPLKVRAPREVGADRIVNALAARELLGTPSVVVDVGTATTVDAVSRAGEYLGGAIMPGPALAAESLKRGTAKLPLVEPGRAARAVGKDTAECIRAGLYFGFLGMIRGVAEATVAELGGRARVAVTGGFARLFERGLPPDYCIMPDLTLQGLRLAHEALEARGDGG